MPCFHPSRHPYKANGPDFQRTQAQSWKGEPWVNVRCNQCMGCRRAIQRDWSVRCFHEGLTHSEKWRDPKTKVTTEIARSCMVTLTYDPEHMPPNGALQKRDFQLFIMRLRNRRVRSGELDQAPRFFMSGEYGGRTKRPHYHAILFGESFDDRYEMRDMSGQVTTHSYELDELWAKPVFKGAPPTNIGRATVDPLSYATAGYVAGYIAKKGGIEMGPWAMQTEQRSPRSRVRPILAPIQPEYRSMSVKPGLASEWIRNPLNLQETAENGCRIGPYTFPMPRYYDNVLAEDMPKLHAKLAETKIEAMDEAAHIWTPERCDAAEQIAFLDLQQRRDSL